MPAKIRITVKFTDGSVRNGSIGAEDHISTLVTRLKLRHGEYLTLEGEKLVGTCSAAAAGITQGCELVVGPIVTASTSPGATGRPSPTATPSATGRPSPTATPSGGAKGRQSPTATPSAASTRSPSSPVRDYAGSPATAAKSPATAARSPATPQQSATPPQHPADPSPATLPPLRLQSAWVRLQSQWDGLCPV